ncbi:hypothetical protein [Paenisporosarcina sp. OV554]|uniref:hypothetical protein n=1 Tax=Paenisporosarcina sp. OV554 TaxID=2135694 RepID=UPI000D37945D|nr:hypothetical protein [Paenisporosarcina sp. OV554]PUB12605.1 hypothetical protein C8K15_109104 [Paenisporosarcina sp. OV554]
MNYHVFEDKKFDLKFDFTDEELNDFTELWNGDISAENIATKMKRKQMEIVLLIMDRAELGIIKGRPSGLNGL